VTEPSDEELLRVMQEAGMPRMLTLRHDEPITGPLYDGLRAIYDKGKSDGAARLAHLEESARLLRELFRFGLRPTMVHEGMLAEGESLNAWLEADKEAP
jgi:hypothetical protein